ncbi:hypothetical protein HYV91_03445 [Candidatus Wolfebacteria bacterium]|nr:hypothetical protein [Candidatus Wolfebacteria bacterium]
MPLALLGDWRDEDLGLLTFNDLPVSQKIKKIFFWTKVILTPIIKLFFRLRKKHQEILILEYGLQKNLKIRDFLEMAKPDIGVVTAVGDIPAHVEFWSGPWAVAREKSKVVECLDSDGFAVLNFDDEAVLEMKKRTRARIITFGFGPGADVRIMNFENQFENPESYGINFKIGYGGSVVPVKLRNVFGKAEAYAASAAVCIGLIFDLNLVEIAEALQSSHSLYSGKRILKGVKETVIIEDLSDVSPLSMDEAIHVLGEFRDRRKIAVLGDMLDLGKWSIEAHEAIGRLTSTTVDLLFTVGPRGKLIAEGAREGGLFKNKILSYDTSVEAGRKLQDLLKKGDAVLITGARELRMGEVVEEVKSN